MRSSIKLALRDSDLLVVTWISWISRISSRISRSPGYQSQQESHCFEVDLLGNSSSAGSPWIMDLAGVAHNSEFPLDRK
jgi:hypothetical protein